MHIMPSRRTTFFASLVAASLAGNASASAATFSRAPDGAVAYAAAPGEQNRIVAYSNDDGTMTLYDPSGTSAGTVPDGCTGSAGPATWSVVCPLAPVEIDFGDGDDSLSVSNGLNVAVTANGGDGNDELVGNAAVQTLDGGPGNDKIDGNEGDDTVRGGDGNDTVEGGAGRDTVEGGAGDDLVSGDGYEGQYTDVIDGGPGTDRIEQDFGDRFQSSSAQPPVAITLGGGADDGRPNEGDDVRGVERIAVNIPGSYTGTDAPEWLEIRQVLGSVTLDGRGGDDTLIGADGQDRIDGGAGDDMIDAGFGDDTIVGGPGRDTIRADRTTTDCSYLWCKYPYGNDAVDAVDGEVDSITCGAGTDAVRADPQDVVAPDCETVTRVGGGAGNAGGSTSGGGTTGVISATLSLRRVPALAAALRHGLAVQAIGVPAGKKLTVTARSGSRTLGHGTAKASSAGSATVTIRFTASGRRWATRQKAVSLTLSGAGATTAVTLRRNR